MAEGCNGPQIRLFIILLLLYADDGVLFAYDPSSMHKLLRILKDCMKCVSKFGFVDYLQI